jgi:hypothetical protein
MVAPGSRVFVFTRDNDPDPVTYQGVGHPERWQDTEPVTIWWRFNGTDGQATGIGSPAERAGEPQASGQGTGFGSHEDNLAVERAAVDHVAALYRAAGWEVQSVEAERVGYDLCCRRGHQERHVEVKGVAGAAPTFMLTEGERRRAETDLLWRVAIVTDALAPGRRCLEVAGADFLGTWQLTPVTWRASPVA